MTRLEEIRQDFRSTEKFWAVEPEVRYLLALVDAADGMANILAAAKLEGVYAETLARYNAIKEGKPSPAAPVR